MKDALTVFHIDGEKGLRGGERQLLYLACALRRRGHRSVVACREPSPLAAEAARLGLERLALPFLAEFDPLSAAALRRAAGRAERPVLHAHTAHAASVAALESGVASGSARVDFAGAAALEQPAETMRAMMIRRTAAGYPESRFTSTVASTPVPRTGNSVFATRKLHAFHCFRGPHGRVCDDRVVRVPARGLGRR